LLGIDGLISFAVDAAAACGPLLLIWLLVRRLSPPMTPRDPDAVRRLARKVLGRALLFIFTALPLAVVAFDVHSIHVRYLTPMLVPLPLWLVLAAPQNLKGAGRFLGVAFTVAALVTIAWPQTTLFGRHRFAYPYAELAAAIAADTPPPLALLGERPDLAQNFVLRIPGSSYFRPEAAAPRVIAVWIKDGTRDRLIAEAGPAYAPIGPERSYTQPHYFFSGNVATIHTQLLERR